MKTRKIFWKIFSANGKTKNKNGTFCEKYRKKYKKYRVSGKSEARRFFYFFLVSGVLSEKKFNCSDPCLPEP